MRRLCALVVVLAAAVSARATPFFDPFDQLRAELNAQRADLTDATDPASRRRLAVVTRALAAIAKRDADAEPTNVLDVKTALATFPAIEKAFAAEFKDNGRFGSLGSALSQGAWDLEQNVRREIDEFASSIEFLRAGKLKDAAQRQADVALRGLDPDFYRFPMSSYVRRLRRAQSAVAKGVALAARATEVNTVTAWLGTSAYVGRKNRFYYDAKSGSVRLYSDSFTQAPGLHAQFTFASVRTDLAPITGDGAGAYSIAGTVTIGPDSATAKALAVLPGTLYITSLDVAAQRASGWFVFTVKGHPEVSIRAGAFDIYKFGGP